ncbi:MAG: succinylglutamate desuccinylase/aspartoacylase family protein [Sphingomonadaceae bacterium]|nr:succinylglutamate desuccinylase/aspartoacylase family protein [Sphingomonadaceae bacterium]
MDKAAPFEFADSEVAPGKRAGFEIPISRVSAGQTVGLPVRVAHGRKPGPVLFVSAAIHGDEITGVEIIRRLFKRVSPRSLSGTLLCVPIVNVYGFVANSRYLPDRRDLNRSFPGSKTGSLASQLAHIFRSEIIERADFGIDLHSAAIHRKNLPQIRISPDSPMAERLANAFGAPAIITSPLRDSSLRKVALDAGVEMLLFEAGEGLRLDEFSIRTGVNGILRVMEAMEMLPPPTRRKVPHPPLHSKRSLWVRAPRGGVCVTRAKSGDIVREGQRLALIANPVTDEEDQIVAPIDGLIIGHATLPIVNRGDALFHIAQVEEIESAADRVDGITDAILTDTMLDEDEVM